MRCPVCGAPDFRAATLLENIRSQAWSFVGLVACVTGAIVGQAELVGEPWRHWISVTFIVCTAVLAWGMKGKTAA